jgi:hypothetical protein
MSNLVSAALSPTAQFLRTLEADSLTKLKGREAIFAAARLLRTFGLQNAQHIQRQLKKSSEIHGLIHTVCEVFTEIQDGLFRGQNHYTELPVTAKLLNTLSSDRDSCFSTLQDYSCRSLSFPQEILALPEPERDRLKKIEEVRNRALSIMFARLNPDLVDECKGRDSYHAIREKMSEEDELAVTEVFFNGAAFVIDNKTVYISDVVALWKNQNEKYGKVYRQFLEQLSTRRWAKEVVKSFPLFQNVKGEKVGEFWTQLSLAVIQKQLDLVFSEELRRKFGDLLSDSTVRSEVCYYLSDLESLYDMDVSRLKRSSTEFLRAIQVFLFLVREHGVVAEKRDWLLLMLVNMRPNWDVKNLAGFEARWWKKGVQKKECPVFREAWRCLEALLRRMNGGDESDPDCWALFHLLWQSERRKLLIEAFYVMGEDQRFTLTVPIVYQFCKMYQNTLKRETVDFLCQAQSQVLKVLDENGIEVEHTELLIMAPPLENLENPQINPHMQLGIAAETARRFVQLMKECKFPPGKRYVTLLHNAILYPTNLLLTLLKDAPRIGIEKYTEEFIWKTLSAHHSFRDKEGKEIILYPEEICEDASESYEGAIRKAAVLQQRYQFPDMEIFSLYTEMIRLMMAHERHTLGSTARFIAELEAFSPAVGKNVIYFLFRYHPKIDLAEWKKLVAARDAWAQDEQELNQFIINPAKIKQNLDAVEAFVTTLSEACGDDSAPFMGSLRQVLRGGFFGPIQPLTDFFRITNLTVKDGIRWSEPLRATHLGQVKLLSDQSKTGVYLNWEICRGYPTLFISFLDMKKNIAFSSFVSLQVSADSLIENQRRKSFYLFLFNFTQIVLNEQVHLPENYTERGVGPDRWTSCFLGLQELVADKDEQITEQDVAAIWDFTFRLKVLYRNLFLSTVTNRPILPHISEDPKVVASEGRIYPAHPRGSLIDQPLLDITPYPQFYLPDAHKANLASYMDKFQDVGQGELQLNLVVTNGPQKIEAPIYYSVESVSEIKAKAMADDDEKEADEEDPRRYVTLSVNVYQKRHKLLMQYPPEALSNLDLFQGYFDAHNLFLKSLVFHELQ